jgi:hypothetical protein
VTRQTIGTSNSIDSIFVNPLKIPRIFVSVMLCTHSFGDIEGIKLNLLVSHSTLAAR